MGLDMCIFSTPRKEAETMKGKLEKLEEGISSEVSKHDLENDKLLISKLAAFKSRYTTLLPEYDDSEPIIDYLVGLVDTFAYGGYEMEDVKWEMFNKFSRFVGTDIVTPVSNQDEIANTFMQITKDFMYPKSLQTKVSEYRHLQKRRRALVVEECHWRKFHELNDYMCETFGAANCEDTELSLGMVDLMVKVCRENNDDTKQLSNLIKRWDDSRKYYYHPWW